MIDRERVAREKAQTMVWNIWRSAHLLQLTDGEACTAMESPRDPGWYIVSRHASGVAAAYVALSRIRPRWPSLDIKVRNTVDVDVDWQAEIIARRKEDGNAPSAA